MDDITFRKDEDLESIGIRLPLNLVGRASTMIEAKVYYNRKKDNIDDIQKRLIEMLEAAKTALMLSSVEEKPKTRR